MQKGIHNNIYYLIDNDNKFTTALKQKYIKILHILIFKKNTCNI